MKKGVMKDIKQRIGMSLLCIALLVLFIGLAPYDYFKPIFTLAVATVSCFALWEYFQIGKVKGTKPFVKSSILLSVLYVFSVYFSTQWPVLDFLPYAILAITLAFLFLKHFSTSENALISISVSFFGIVYIVVTLAGIVSITYFFKDGNLGRLWLIYLLAVTKMTDIGGLFIGRFFGNRKLLYKVSPNKTVEGALGGILFATVTSVVFNYFADLGISFSISILLGVILSIFAEIGDLAESLLKRDGGIKDSNPHFPGLGGFFDMVDSLIFTTPVLYIFLRITMSYA